MGLLDNLGDQAAVLGEKAKDGLWAAKDKAADLVGEVKHRLDADAKTPTEEIAPADEARARYDVVLHAAQERATEMKSRPDSI